MRAAIYVRVSTDEQAKEGYSIEAQINTLTLYAHSYSYQVVNIYKDEGISGKSNERPGLKAMLRDAGNKQFDIVLVWKISRLSRNLRSLLNIVDALDELEISFISQSETFNTSTPVGRMTLQILGSIAEFERNTIIENVKLGLEEKAKRGEWLGGRVYGYKSLNKELVVDKEQAKVVREIYELYNKNFSISKIAHILYNKGYKTLNDKDFLPSTVYRILTNPIYSGYLRHGISNSKEYRTVKGTHASIISENVYKKTLNKINKTKKIVRHSRQFLLSGILKCPLCGSNLVGYATKNYRYYRCGKYHNYGKKYCKGFLINAQTIEKNVLAYIVPELKKPSIHKKIYDILKISEIFDENFATDFYNLDIEKKISILRYMIDSIVLSKEKTIQSIIII